jgi:hypothetical protein
MALAREEMLSLAKGLSLEVSEQDIEDYEALLARMQNALELVAAMDGKQARSDFNSSIKYLASPQITNQDQTRPPVPGGISTFPSQSTTPSGHGPGVSIYPPILPGPMHWRAKLSA